MTLGKQQRLCSSTLIYLFFYSVSSVPTGNDEAKCQSVVCQTKNMICGSLWTKASDTIEHSASFYRH